MLMLCTNSKGTEPTRTGTLTSPGIASGPFRVRGSWGGDREVPQGELGAQGVAELPGPGRLIEVVAPRGGLLDDPLDGGVVHGGERPLEPDVGGRGTRPALAGDVPAGREIRRHGVEERVVERIDLEQGPG